MPVNRRNFLRGMAGAASAAALVGTLHDSAQAQTIGLPSPEASQIEHIIVVMMENRSFDHLLGWLPGANGKQAGLSFVDSFGESHPTTQLTTYVGCAHPDPDHSYAGGRSEVNGGLMDGWLQTTTNDTFSIGYYTEEQLSFFGAMARNFTTCDNYFASILGPTFPNRIFQLAGQTDRLSNTLDISTLPTIFDTLAAAGVSSKYYFGNVPFLALWGTKYLPISEIFDQFLLDAAAGTLPAVSFVDPSFTILDDGEGNDDHPHADLRAGEAFMGQIYRAVTSGPKWGNTVVIFNRDEWGGFYDTVPPTRVNAPNSVDTDLVEGKTLLGCRVPVVVVSPFTQGAPATPRIDSNLYDHTSVLKLIEWRYNLPPLTSRDASNDIANLALALNFTSPGNAVAPALPVIVPPIPTPCGLFELASEIDNESYDFFKLLVSDLVDDWRSAGKSIPAAPSSSTLPSL
ncbi:alkaline phosphatase family protein [Granulicella mallensis]|uniref:phospholipase C n=1 Tax=Granulicella mallensis TaxID=940614 RepID=A0A7W7ZR77_9BACT|nr:alkaline phosphatase family protein [Granulicella mallensis]MBB5064650.1 phospholipase C [Granulicella mallensis]